MPEETKISLLEQKLLDKELLKLSLGLAALNKQIDALLVPYGTLNGAFGEQLKAFIIEQLIIYNEAYFAGHTTQVAFQTNLKAIKALLPEPLEAAMRGHAVNAFLKNVEKLKEPIY